MSAANFERSALLRLERIERDLKRLSAKPADTAGYQLLPDGTPFFTGGYEIGGGSRLAVYEPVTLPPPTDIVTTAGSSFDTIYLDIDWQQPTGPGSDQVAAYLVQVTKHGETGPIETTVNSGLTYTRVQPLEPNTTYDIQVASVSRNGRNSPATTAQATTGKDTSAPSSPSGLNVSVGVQSLIVKWNSNTERDVANGAGTYRVRVSTQSNLASPVYDQLTSGTVALVPSLLAGTNYYVGVNAIDSSGNASPLGTPSGGPWVPTDFTTADLALAIGGGNVVRDSGFEGGGISWTLGTGCSIDSSTYHAGMGTKSLTITGTGDYFSYEDVTLPQGTWIVSAWAKASGVTGAGQGVVLNWSLQSGTGSGATVLMGGTSSGGKVVAGTGTFDWKRLAFQISITSSVAVLRIQPQRGFGGSCSGTAWFDDVQAEMGTNITAYAPRADELLPGTVTGSILADGSVTTNKIVAGAVVANSIAAGAIGTIQLAAAAVTAGKIAADTITANEIATGAITATEIASNAVTTAKLAANAITASKIAAATITTDKLVALNSLSVGQVIQSSDFVAGSTGWRISGTGNAEFSNATIRGSAIVGGSIDISGKLLVSNIGGDMHVFSNLEIGSNYSGTLYSGAPVSGGGTFGVQIGNDGVPGGIVWSHLQAPIGGNPNWILGMYDNYGSGKRVWFANSTHDTWNPGPDGRIVAEKRSQDGDFATKGILIQNGPGSYPGTNPDHAGIGFHTPDRAMASILQMVGSVSNALEVRAGDNLSFAPIKASAFLVNSSIVDKSNVADLPVLPADKFSKLRPVIFNRPGSKCSFCDDTGWVTHEGLHDPTLPPQVISQPPSTAVLTGPTPEADEIAPDQPLPVPPMLQLGDKCPLCKGKKGQGGKRRPAGAKKTEDSSFVGLVAEEVAQLFPNAVSWVGETDADLKPDGIDYSAITALSVAKLQDLEKRLVVLEGKRNK